MKDRNPTGGLVKEVMTVREVARYLRLSEAKVYRMARSGEIPVIRIGRAWRFKRELVDAWLRQMAEQADRAEMNLVDDVE